MRVNNKIATEIRLRFLHAHHLLPFLLAAMAMGCALTPNLAAHQSRYCEVHNTEMEMKDLPWTSGNTIYLEAFRTARQGQFPHDDGVRWEDDWIGSPPLFIYPASRRVRDYVCPDCAAAHRQWLAEHPNLR